MAGPVGGLAPHVRGRLLVAAVRERFPGFLAKPKAEFRAPPRGLNARTISRRGREPGERRRCPY